VSDAQPPQPPGARLLLGKPVAASLNAETKTRLAAFVGRHGYAPILAVVSVAATPEATRYTDTLRRGAAAVGFAFERMDLPVETDAAALAAQLRELNGSAQVAGVIVMTPLPPHIPFATVEETLDPRKDVDGVTPANAGRLALGLGGFAPGTPAGGIALLAHYDIPVAGRRAVMVGRSNVVGRPFALLLLHADATVTVAHSRTGNLAAITREADILAVAVGRPGAITPEMVRPGAVVIDFGTNYTADGLRGDVAPEVAAVAGAMAPVPGGTGPVTNAALLRNVLHAAEAAHGEQQNPL